MSIDKAHITKIVKEKAHELGFMEVAIVKAEKLAKHESGLHKWLQGGYAAGMDYMHNHFEKRLDPTALVPGTKSMVLLLYNYFTDQKPTNYDYKISKYAYGRDYHKVVKKKLKKLMAFITEQVPYAEGRFFVDSAPVMERQWAEKAGLGWRGKHSLLINKQYGSYFFIGELLLTVELKYDSSTQTDHCGTCTKCIDACPTNAILDNGIIDSNKCISYLTIENKGDIDEPMKSNLNNWIFGCDICQEVCPWNRFSIVHSEPDFVPKPALQKMKPVDWEHLDKDKFDLLFEGSSVKRTGYEGLKRNIKAAKNCE